MTPNPSRPLPPTHTLEYYCWSEFVPFLQQEGWDQDSIRKLRRFLLDHANGHDCAGIDINWLLQDLNDYEDIIEMLRSFQRAGLPNDFNVDMTL